MPRIRLRRRYIELFSSASGFKNLNALSAKLLVRRVSASKTGCVINRFRRHLTLSRDRVRTFCCFQQVLNVRY